MILIDTSVWIDHLGHPNEALSSRLVGEMVLIHPFVIGEIALGSLRNRQAIVDDFRRLPMPIVAEHDEVVDFIVTRELGGTGIGYVDAHLLASATSTADTALWTYDKRLAQCAEQLGLLSPESKLRLN